MHFAQWTEGFFQRACPAGSNNAAHEVAHHSYSHRPPTAMTPAEERADFDRALAVFAGQGIEISGHRAALWETTWQTAELVAEHGLRYDSSMMGDDRPYRIDTGHGTIVELPVHWSLDDWEQYAYLPAPQIGSVIESPAKVLEIWRAELDAMRHYRTRSPRCSVTSRALCQVPWYSALGSNSGIPEIHVTGRATVAGAERTRTWRQRWRRWSNSPVRSGWTARATGCDAERLPADT